MVLAVGVTIATKIVPGIYCDTGFSLVVVVLLLSFFNAILRPVLLLFTLPFILLTLGLGVLVINALLFLAVGGLVSGFHVAGFWSALGGSLVVSLTSLLLNRFIVAPRQVAARSGPTSPQPPPAAPASRAARNDDVIDI